MKVVLITREDLEHVYLANRLCEQLDISAIIVDRGQKRSRWRRLFDLFRRYGTVGIFQRAALVAYRRLVGDSVERTRELTHVFGEDQCLAFAKPAIVKYVSGINGAESLRILDDLKPDLILVYGTGIVGKKVLAQAKRLTLNMHTGLSPYYRGASCVFWPLHNQDLENLGVTVHECTAQVDAGKIFAVANVRPERSDGLHTVFARAVVVGAGLYAHVAKKVIDGQPEGIPQDLSLGREYKVAMRGLKAELYTRKLIRNGLIRDFVDRISPPTVP